MKLQVREWNICLNIRDLKCDVGVTVYTLVWLELEIRAFHGAIYKTVKVLHESGPILHEGAPAQRIVLKAIRKMVLAAS